MVENMSLDTDIEIEENDQQYKERINRTREVAHRPFSEKKIGIAELKNRLQEIKNTGYYIQDYSCMNREGLLKYLKQIQKEADAALKRPAYFDR